jgi:hypothetical protein
MLGLFRPLEDYVGPSILTVVALCSVAFLGCMLKFSSEFVCLPFVERDISTISSFEESDYNHFLQNYNSPELNLLYLILCLLIWRMVSLEAACFAGPRRLKKNGRRFIGATECLYMSYFNIL